MAKTETEDTGNQYDSVTWRTKTPLGTVFRGTRNIKPNAEMLSVDGYQKAVKLEGIGYRYMVYDRDYVVYCLTRFLTEFKGVPEGEFFALMAIVWERINEQSTD